MDTVSGSVGADLRALRKSRSITLNDLALKLRRSIGWISQVERGISEPSISDLRKFAEIFDVSVSFFFHNDDAPAEERDYVVRASRRRSLGNPSAGLIEELLSPDIGGAFEMVRSIFAPGAELTEPQKRETEESGFIVSGTLDLWINENKFRLEPGDSFRFSHEPYRWKNPGTVETIAIWTIAPPVY